MLNVYDPDRSRGVVSRAGGNRTETTWDKFSEALKGAEIGANGAGLVVLAEASRSPSVARMRKGLSAAKWFEYEVVSNDNQRAGAMQVTGRPLRAVPHLNEAAVIVSIDADLFHGGSRCQSCSVGISRRGGELHDSSKAASAEMNRLYVLESGFSITGSMADHRRGVKPSELPGGCRRRLRREGWAGSRM